MSRYIRKKQAEAPEKYSSIEIKEAEYEELPIGTIKGGSNSDVMIADTDDYYKILENLFESNRKGWRAIAPICPDDPVGLERISEELGALATSQMITKRNIPIRILPNRCGRDNGIENDIETIRMYLEARGVSGLMSQYYIHNASATYSPIFLEEDKQFYTQLVNVLSEIGIK